MSIRGRMVLRTPSTAGLLFAIAMAASTHVSAAAFDPKPWLEDLQQIRDAMSEKYANFDWLIFEREADLADLFARAQERLLRAADDVEAKAALDRLTRSLGNGHVRIEWPRIVVAPDRQETSPAKSDACVKLGYDVGKNGEALGPRIPGYQPFAESATPEFPAGLLRVGGKRVGILRIGLFGPQGSPALCESALRDLRLPPDADCDERCSDEVEKRAYTALSRDLASRLRMLAKTGAQTLLIDLTGNGGGSDWTEAAARIVGPIDLRSERMGFVRGPHWVRKWRSLEEALRRAAAESNESDQATLESWMQEVDRKRIAASTPCSSASFWSRRRPDCEWLGTGFFATGILGQGDAAALRKKPWGALVFSPAQYEFEQAVWHGPLIVLVDGNTGSAAEEFAAVLQDNGAALIAGAPTAGAGCGHTDGGTPTTLQHSGAVLYVPDCARLRGDGSNEVAGIDPDILIGFRQNDGPRRKALRVLAALPAAMTAAERLWTARDAGQGKRRRPLSAAAPGSPRSRP